MEDTDRTTPIYSIGVVKEKTSLTGRQIRYYEECDLIKPARTDGNQRIYSQQDIERLKKIKELLDKGLNIAGIKKKLDVVNEKNQPKNIAAQHVTYDGRPLNKFSQGSKGLTSLYPVSNRAQLYEVLNKEDSEQD